MRWNRLGAVAALGAVLVTAVSVGVASAATNPSATASQAGSPSTIACGGTVQIQATVSTQAGTSGQATDVMLVLDLSGSMGSPAGKFTDLKRAATDALTALNAADGLAGNRVGLVTYRDTTASLVAAPGASFSTLSGDISSLAAPSGDSPHNLGIDAGAAALAASTNAKAIVLISDGQATGSDLTNSTNSATTAKGHGIRIVPIGIGADVTKSNLQNWASSSSYYQDGTAAPIDQTKLISDLGAAVSVPTSFALTETPGTNFTLSPVSSTAGTVTSGTTLQWTATLPGTQSATLVFNAVRNGTNVFATTTEVASTLSLLTVSGGTATITPPAATSVDVLPCGGTPLASTTCTGAACNTSATQGGVQYAVNAGTPPAGTSLSLSSVNTATPPPGVCAGFASHTQGAELDIRPLTTSTDVKLVIPKASLGTKKWFQTDVCLGSNLRFITAISSLLNLSPDATFVSGGTLPGRWWGLLPSIPRLAWFPGHGFVLGPYITSRSQDSAGNAVITFRSRSSPARRVSPPTARPATTPSSGAEFVREGGPGEGPPSRC